MIDKIRLSLPEIGVDFRTGIGGLSNCQRRDINTWTGAIGNMRVHHNLDGLVIHGSLAKFLKGENCTPLSREGVRAAVEKLERDTGLNLATAVVTSLEVGSSIILKKRPGDYLRLFGDPAKYTKTICSKAGLIETVLYGTPTGAFSFCAYDKSREMGAKKQVMPELFREHNVLRLEYRIIKRRGIQARFNRDLTVHDLFEYGTYRRLQQLFFEAYRAIPKTGRGVFINTAKPLTPARLEQLEAEQWRQTMPENHNAVIQNLKESGALTKKNYERVRAVERRQGRDFKMSDKNPLITELDSHISALNDLC